MNIAMPPDEFWLGLLLAIVVVVLLSLIFYWNDWRSQEPCRM